MSRVNQGQSLYMYLKQVYLEIEQELQLLRSGGSFICVGQTIDKQLKIKEGSLS